MITINQITTEDEIEVEVNCTHDRGTHKELVFETTLKDGEPYDREWYIEVCDRCDKQLEEE